MRLGQSASLWPELRQLKHNFFELTICLHFAESFTSVQSFILCPVPSQNTHSRLVAFSWLVLKFLSLRIGVFSSTVSVTGFSQPIVFCIYRCSYAPSSLTKYDRIFCSLSSVFLTYPLTVRSFSIISNGCTHALAVFHKNCECV